MRTFECSYPAQVKTKTGQVVDFDPVGNATHRRLLDRNIDEYRHTHAEAADARLDHIEADRHVAVLIDDSVSSVEKTGDTRMTIRLNATQSKPAAAPKVASQYENRYPGFKLVEFRPYESIAILERLTDKQVSARGILANELGINPWQVQVEATGEGGWRCTLDRTVIYSPAKMDAATERACQQIGHVGWWFQADIRTGVILIHPGQPVTFKPVHPYPYSYLGGAQWRDRTPFGVLLPSKGDSIYDLACVDWKESPFLIIGGEPRSGKSVLANNLLAGIIAQRPELTIINLSNKATDYYWARPWVSKNGFAVADDVRRAGVVNRLVWQIEHGERAKAWMDNAWQNWLDIPEWAKRKYPLHYIVIDEFSSIVDRAQTVKTIPNPEKTLPAVFGELFVGQAENQVKTKVQRIIRTAGAQGYRVILISQTINERSGLGPTFRDLFGHRIAQGANPSESLIKGVFHDQANVPDIPLWIRKEEGLSKGVGRAELAGASAVIYKTFWAGHDGMSDTEALARALVDTIGLPADVDERRYLDTIRHHDPEDPMDAEYMKYLTDRITPSYQDMLDTDPILKALKTAWEASEAEFGDGAPTETAETKPETPTPELKPAGTGARLMDAHDLARIMEQG